MNLSTQADDRIVKLARTIIDLKAFDVKKGSHISEAIQYKSPIGTGSYIEG